MKRSFLIIIGIIIALCLGLHFYLHWDMKRFKASLPNQTATPQSGLCVSSVFRYDSVRHAPARQVSTRIQ